MKYIILAAALIAGTASAQIPGYLDCFHTRTDETLVLVRVALLEPAKTGRGRQYGDPRELTGANIKTQVVTFDEAGVATKIIGFRLTCAWEMPSPIDYHEFTFTQYWEATNHIPIAVGVNPGLGVLVEEPGPSLKKVTIGKK